MKKWMRRWRGVLAGTLAAALLSGCGVAEAFSSGNKTEKEYGKPETLVIVTSERLRYEELYTDQIWNTAVDNRGTTFESVLIEQIHDFMKELKVMSLMAKEEKIKLSSREKDLVKEAARRYYETLGGTEASKFGIDQKALEALYTDYWISEKLVDRLTEGMNLEVSDSEAKVITVLEIGVDDEALANEILGQVRTEGTDFSSVAQDYAGDEGIRRQVMRGARSQAYEEAAFALSVGEISQVIEENERYYVLKCVDDYDEAATRTHKQQMIRQKKNEAFYGSYQSFKGTVELEEDSGLWLEMDISDSPKVTADFFGIFEEICREQE